MGPGGLVVYPSYHKDYHRHCYTDAHNSFGTLVPPLCVSLAALQSLYPLAPSHIFPFLLLLSLIASHLPSPDHVHPRPPSPFLIPFLRRRRLQQHLTSGGLTLSLHPAPPATSGTVPYRCPYLLRPYPMSAPRHTLYIPVVPHAPLGTPPSLRFPPCPLPLSRLFVVLHRAQFPAHVLPFP